MRAREVVGSATLAKTGIFLAALLGAVPACGLAKGRHDRIVVPGGVLSVAQSGAVTTLTMHGGRRPWRLRLPADNKTIISAGTFDSADLVGLVGRSVLVLTTTYASQTGVGGPRVQCAAGQEVILRVIRLAPDHRQTFMLPLESCWTDVYRTPVRWDAATSSFRVADGAGSPDDTVPPYRVDARGVVTQGPAPR